MSSLIKIQPSAMAQVVGDLSEIRELLLKAGLEQNKIRGSSLRDTLTAAQQVAAFTITQANQQAQGIRCDAMKEAATAASTLGLTAGETAYSHFTSRDKEISTRLENLDKIRKFEPSSEVLGTNAKADSGATAKVQKLLDGDLTCLDDKGFDADDIASLRAKVPDSSKRETLLQDTKKTLQKLQEQEGNQKSERTQRRNFVLLPASQGIIGAGFDSEKAATAAGQGQADANKTVAQAVEGVFNQMVSTAQNGQDTAASMQSQTSQIERAITDATCQRV